MEQAGYESSDSGVYDVVDTAYPFEYKRQPGKDYSGEGPSTPGRRRLSGGYVPTRGLPQSSSSSTPPENVEPIRGDSLHEYSMDSSRRRLALIFNHTVFDSSSTPSRHGTAVDVDALMSAFTSLGFDITRYDNMCYHQIGEALNQAAAEDHSNSDCIAVAVLTHGLEGDMLMARDQPYPITSLTEPFRPSLCPSLTGKPKLFFIQASRGYDTAAHGGSSGPCSYGDVLVSYSSAAGCPSFRNLESGSWYVQTLCRQLETHGRTMDLVSLLTNVTRIVSEEFRSVNYQVPWLNGMVQEPCFTSSLKRQLWFR